VRQVVAVIVQVRQELEQGWHWLVRLRKVPAGQRQVASQSYMEAEQLVQVKDWFLQVEQMGLQAEHWKPS
jgi:hypothetical protein